MIWENQSSKEPFQEILDRRLLKFNYGDSHDRQRSGMTSHQEWMLSVGIKFNFSGKAKH